MEEFIKTLTEQIRCVKAREGVAREISDHILDQTAAYELAGDDHDEALKKAVRDMGDPVEVGVALDAIHRPKIDWKMLVITFVLSIIGLAVMYTTGDTYMFPRQCIFTLIGFAVIVGICLVDYTYIGRYSHIIYIALTVFLIFCWIIHPSIGGINYFNIYIDFREINGRIPAMSSLVYLFVPLFAGVIYKFRGQGWGAIIRGILLTFWTAWLTNLLSDVIFVGIIICMINMIILIAAICKNWFKVNKKAAITVCVAALIIPAILVLCYMTFGGATYQQMRIRAFLNPSAYATDAGYIPLQIKETLNNANIVGAYENQVPNDVFISSNLMIIYTIRAYGLLAGAVIVLALAVFVLRATNIVRSQKNQLGYIISLSCMLVFAVNCLEGILVNTGYFPLTSTWMPFISYGGSITLVYSVLIGLLLSVHRYEKVVSEPKMPDKRTAKWSISITRGNKNKTLDIKIP